MNVKYVRNDTKKLENGKVHVKEGTDTGCGAKIDDNPQNWVYTTEQVTCNKNGCKNKL